MDNIYTSTKEEILSNAYLYQKCTSLLKQVGFKVFCNCGNAKKIMNIETFLNNKLNIMEAIVKIENRTIFPKWNGVLYSSRAMKHFNAKSMTDEKILELVNSGMLSKDLFDWSKYKGDSNKNEVEVKEEDEEKEEFPDEYKEENIQEELSFETENVKGNVMDIINSLKEEGKGNGEIAKILNEMGYKTDKGKEFYAVNVTKLLNK